MTEEKRKLLHPTSEILASTYNLLYKKGEVSFPIHEGHIFALDSIVKTINAEYFGFVRFPTNEDKAAAYFCYIIKNHPVVDGNKRLAVLWLDIFCNTLGIKINPSIKLDELAVAVEREKLEMEKLIRTVKIILFGRENRN